MTEIKEYLERKGKNYETLSSYIMSEDKDDETFQSLLDIFEHQNDKDEFEEYLTTLSYICFLVGINWNFLPNYVGLS